MERGRTADQNQEEDARGSVLQEVWRGHEQGRQGGALAERPARCEVRGRAANRVESPQDHDWKMLARQTRGTFSHLASGHVVAWAEAVLDEQLDDADLHKAWRRQQRLVGLKPSWSKVSGPTGAITMCLRQLGWTWPHHTTFVTASGHEVDLRQICPRDVKAQATVDRELALWREWADNDERKELLPCLLLEPVVLANKRAHRRPQEAPVGRDTIWMLDARGCEQGGNC